jgi:hypothetical protein
MERAEFVTEGKMEIGPKGQYFTFLDDDRVGRLVLKHFGLREELGHGDLGRYASA